MHILSEHLVKFRCPHCKHQAAWKENLRIHILSKHDLGNFECLQCDHQATQKRNWEIHILSKHGRVKFKCTEFDQQATKQGFLRIHVLSKHNQVKLKCLNVTINQLRKEIWGDISLVSMIRLNSSSPNVPSSNSEMRIEDTYP